MESTIKAAAFDPSLQQRYDPEEWRVRVELAALYRLADRFRMTDTIFTHITAKVPGTADHFLINPYKTLFHEVTASNLVKIDLDGNIVEPTPHEVNKTGFVIHGAIHRARPDAHCVWHSHTRAGVAVSAQKGGLLPISQYALPFYNRIGYHDYEGLALDEAVREKLVRDLGGHPALILRNHGLVTVGRNIPEACALMTMLDKACRAQIDAQAGGAELIFPSPEVCEHTARQFDALRENCREMEWPALLRLIEDQREDYAS